MDMRKFSVLAIASMLMTACSTTNSTIDNTSSVPDEAAIKLAETATSISQSLTDLKGIEKASAPPVNNKRLPYPTSYDMDQVASVDWSGPIEPLLQRIASVSGYKLRTIGRKPSIPVLVTIDARNTPIGYIIRDANFQAGTKATINVYPAVKIIELRYGRA